MSQSLDILPQEDDFPDVEIYTAVDWARVDDLHVLVQQSDCASEGSYDSSNQYVPTPRLINNLHVSGIQ
jgi:hypothetical protein